MVRIKVSASGSAYFSDDLREEGYIGELDAIPNACILVIRKPGSRIGDAIRSLEILKADLEHRRDMGQE